MGMNLYNTLNPADVDLLHRYLDAFSDGTAIERDRMDFYLRFWDESKKDLYKLFGNNIMLKKKVRYTKTHNELTDSLYEVLRVGKNEATKFVDLLEAEIRTRCDKDVMLRSCLADLIFDLDCLANNVYDGVSFVVPGNCTNSGRPLQIADGCKPVKAIGKLAREFGLEKEFEPFRQAHSQVLNQKAVYGTLCLSIHPLDFLTMSDNSLGWTSCMAWVDDRGDYRLGTVEMMNSPCVVVAYLDADNPYELLGSQWSNKKWRQLFIVNKDIILGNKQYPYENDEVQGDAIQWLKALAEDNWGIKYSDNAIQVKNNNENHFGDRCIKFDIRTNYMYNDVYGNRLAYIRDDYDEYRFDLNFSGVPVCAQCGREIELHSVDSYEVVCYECDEHWTCGACCERYSDNDECYHVDGMDVCRYCYEDADPCDKCENLVFDRNRVQIVLGVSPDTTRVEDIPQYPLLTVKRLTMRNNDLADIYQRFNDLSFSLYLCYDCYNSFICSDKVDKDLGLSIRFDTGHWRGPVTAVNLKSLTDEMIDRIDTDSYTCDILRQIRDAKDKEIEFDLIERLI